MAKCYICNCQVSDDSEKICIRKIKEEYFSICSRCAMVIKCIKSDEYSQEQVDNAVQMLNKIDINKTSQNYINELLVQRKKRMQKNSTKKTMYIYKGIPQVVPKLCSNCMKHTEGTEEVLNMETFKKSMVFKTHTTYVTHKNKFGLCEECLKTRKGFSVVPYASTDSLYGFLFRNKEYAETIAKLNNTTVCSGEFNADVDTKKSQLLPSLRRKWVNTNFYALVIIRIAICLFVLILILKEIF